jgi:hypothetical protein
MTKKHLSSEEFRDRFNSSARGREIIERVEAPVGEGGELLRGIAEKKFANPWSKSLKLLVSVRFSCSRKSSRRCYRGAVFAASVE